VIYLGNSLSRLKKKDLEHAVGKLLAFWAGEGIPPRPPKNPGINADKTRTERDALVGRAERGDETYPHRVSSVGRSPIHRVLQASVSPANIDKLHTALAKYPGAGCSSRSTVDIRLIERSSRDDLRRLPVGHRTVTPYKLRVSPPGKHVGVPLGRVVGRSVGRSPMHRSGE